MKILNGVDFGSDPLGAPLLAGDLSGMTREFSVPLSTSFSSLHPLSFQMTLCEMVSKPYRVHYTQHFHLHTFSNFILESRLVSQILIWHQ